MAYCCYHCGKRIRGQVLHWVPPKYLASLTGESGRAYHPACYERSEREAEAELRGEPFTLTRSQNSHKRETFHSTPTTQRKLLAGLNCLPGQGNLFETDGETH